MLVRTAKLRDASPVDGPGLRTVVWFQGCPIRCAGCQNEALWDREGGDVNDCDDLAENIVTLNRLGACKGNHRYTITGGEPFYQPLGLKYLLRAIRAIDIKAEILVYTGFLWEDLVKTQRSVLQYIDILVDGPYEQDLDHDGLSYRGSTNQRPIRVQESLIKNRVVQEHWDMWQMTFAGGYVVMTGAAAKELNLAGDDIALCGQYSTSEPAPGDGDASDDTSEH